MRVLDHGGPGSAARTGSATRRRTAAVVRWRPAVTAGRAGRCPARGRDAAMGSNRSSTTPTGWHGRSIVRAAGDSIQRRWRRSIAASRPPWSVTSWTCTTVGSRPSNSPAATSTPNRAYFDAAVALRTAVAYNRLQEAAREAAPRFAQYERLREALAHYRTLAGHPAWKSPLPALPPGPRGTPPKLEAGQPYAGRRRAARTPDRARRPARDDAAVRAL